MSWVRLKVRSLMATVYLSSVSLICSVSVKLQLSRLHRAINILAHLKVDTILILIIIRRNQWDLKSVEGWLKAAKKDWLTKKVDITSSSLKSWVPNKARCLKEVMMISLKINSWWEATPHQQKVVNNERKEIEFRIDKIMLVST